MNSSVNFNNQFLFSTVKIRDKKFYFMLSLSINDGMLTEKFTAIQLSFRNIFQSFTSVGVGLFLRSRVNPLIIL